MESKSPERARKVLALSQLWFRTNGMSSDYEGPPEDGDVFPYLTERDV